MAVLWNVVVQCMELPGSNCGYNTTAAEYNKTVKWTMIPSKEKGYFY
jgi:hypothetical protein